MTAGSAFAARAQPASTAGWFYFWGFFLIGLFGYTLRAVDYFASIPGDIGDARFMSVVLEHLFQWLSGRIDSLWSPTFFFPYQGVLAFSENSFGSGPIYILFRLAGIGREGAFEVWFVIGMCLNFVAAYAAMRRLRFSQFGAAAGAFVFSYGLPVLAQEGHAQLTYRFGVPLAYAALFELISTRRLLVLWRVLFWTTLQFLCSIYLGFFLCFLLAATFVAALIVERGRGLFTALVASVQSAPLRERLTSAGGIASSTAVITALLYKYHSINKAYHFTKSWSELASMLPRPQSYLLADRARLSSWASNVFAAVPMRHEHQMFFGVAVTGFSALAGILIWRGTVERNLGKTVSLSLALLILLTLNLHNLSLYRLLTFLPGVGAIRAMTRIIVVLALPVGVLVATAAEWLTGHRLLQTPVRRFIVSLVFMSGLGAEVSAYSVSNTPAVAWLDRTAKLRAQLPTRLPGNPILYVTKQADEPDYVVELDAMVLAQDLLIPTLNGYSGNVPPGHRSPEPCDAYINRLHEFATFSHHPWSSVDALAARVFVIAPAPCPQEPALEFEGNVLAEQAKRIELKIGNISVEGDRLGVTIFVKNRSSSPFNTLSASGKPVRLSWRFVPAALPQAGLSRPGWEARQDLWWTIAPSESRSTTLSATVPTKAGKYLLQASLVQEGVAWFQDLGMIVPEVPVTLSVAVEPCGTEVERQKGGRSAGRDCRQP